MKKVISKVQFESNGFQTVFEHSFRVVVGLDILNEGIITDLGYDAICVTTNGVVKRNGELVMGAGVAKQFADKFANIQKILGEKVKATGNHVYHVGTYQTLNKRSKYDVLSFPTKHNYNDKSDLDLIIKSAKRLVKWANISGATNIILPSPGTGLGGLKQLDVFNALDGILDDRFTITIRDNSKRA